MAGRDSNEFSGLHFCGNCGAAITPGATACDQCGSSVGSEENADEFAGDYIHYCRACGVPVAREAALYCPQCGVTPLCRDHFYPSTRTCALCPPLELTPPGGSTQPGERLSGKPPTRPDGPWAQPAAAVLCSQCGARIRQGVEFCANCGAEQEIAGEAAQYAGFLIRLVAAIIDSFITGVPAAIIASYTDIPALGTALSLVYYVMFTYARGQTPGKMLLGLHVVDANGQKPNIKQVLLREVVGKAISALALLMGYLWIIWDPQKRGWHDHMAGTFVVKRTRN